MSGSQKITHKAVSACFKCLGLIPRKLGISVGRFLGRGSFLANKKHREIALNNLTLAYSNEKSPSEIRILAKKIFGNLGQIVFEIAWFWRLDRRDFHKHFRIDGLSHFTNALKKNKGVLLLTAHFGNWELMTVFSGMTGYPVNIIYRPLDFQPMETFFVNLRTRFGGKLIPKNRSMRTILTVLKQGEAVGFLMDQNVDWYEGVFVEFFGRLACTNKGLALLALRTEAPVVPIFLVREGAGFRVEIGQEVPLVKTGDKTKDIEANTQQYNGVIEAFARRYPDQWFWVHQRWKTRPYKPWPKI
ncbi:MAG: lysophospholipid acyltransferase family protein [Deltaproteobacteria bacterium]|nr:lysophospholipid acyltransferase family protein [Deltaproteobacteria bacterium]